MLRRQSQELNPATPIKSLVRLCSMTWTAACIGACQVATVAAIVNTWSAMRTQTPS